MKFLNILLEDREDDDWNLDNPNIDEDGLKAHALLKWLESNGDVDVKTPEEVQKLPNLISQLEKLKEKREITNDEDDLTELEYEIEDLMEEIEEIQNKIDVYNIVPAGQHYNLTQFEVEDSPVEGRTYAVGTEDEMQSSCYDYIEQLIDDVGYEGFRSGFMENYIDEEKVAEYAEEFYNEDVYNNPDSYLSEDLRELSFSQEEEIEILKERISQSEDLIERLKEHIGKGNDESLKEKIQEIQDNISEHESEIDDIENDPQGDFPNHFIEQKIEDLVDDVRRNPSYFMSDFGLEIENFIDKDDFIQGVIDSDGYGNCISSYDGDADEIYVNNKLYYVIRID